MWNSSQTTRWWCPSTPTTPSGSLENTKVAVRYLNLVGDWYLELLDQPGSTRIRPAGTRFGVEQTGACPELSTSCSVASSRSSRGSTRTTSMHLTTSLIQILQGQGGDMESLFARTSSFTNALADNGQTVENLIDNPQRHPRSTGQGRREILQGPWTGWSVSSPGCAEERDPIGEAITALDNGTASLADLLTEARPALSGTVDQLNRMAPLLSNDTDSGPA